MAQINNPRSAAEYVHQACDGRWYVCEFKNGRFYTHSKNGKYQYIGAEPDPWGWHYKNKRDAIACAKRIYYLGL
jgi:hypothetical protein